MRRKLALIFGFVFIELLGYSLVLPLLPYYAETFGASLTLVGLLGTVNAFCQLLAAPVVGRLSDRYGRRPLLLFSIGGTVVSFLILGLAQSLGMIFLSRALDGLFGGNVALARAYIADVTDENSRARSLGIIGAAFGLGFIFGPAMGGLLSAYGYSVPALAAAGLSALNLVAVALWLPESLTPSVRERIRATPRVALTFPGLWEALRDPCCAHLLEIRFVYGLAFTLFQANFALWAKTRLGLTAQSTSYVLTYVGVLAVLVQGLAIGRLTARFREPSLILGGTISLALGMLAWAATPSVLWLLPVLAVLALSGGVLNVVLTSQLTKSVPPERVGGVLGLATSLYTLAQIVSPGVGGFVLERVSSWAPGALGGVLMILTVWLTLRHLAREREKESARAGGPPAMSGLGPNE